MTGIAPNAPYVLTAGGTGGHLFPAQALAEELLRRGRTPVMITDERGSRMAARLPDMDVFTIAAAAPVGGLIGKLRAALMLMRGARQARSLLTRLQPAAVVGFGGYASLPAVWVAQRRGIPTVLHEQNAHLGRANRLLAKKARALALSFAETRAAPADATLVGNPVRTAVTEAGIAPYRAPDPRGDDPIHLLVFGGSQGARVFSDAVPGALADLPVSFRSRIHLTQQARPEDLDRVRQACKDGGVTAEIAPFFHDMPARMADAHLVIARAGASTVAELTAAGRPSVLIPYPHAADDHQTANAMALATAGGAWTVPDDRFDRGTCSRTIAALLEDPAALTRMAAAARDESHADAAARLADLVQQAAGDPPTETEETRS